MKNLLLVLLLALPWGPIACLDSHENMGPATAFETAYQLALGGKYDQTSDFFSDDIIKMTKTNPEMSLQKIWATRLNNGSVKGVKIIERDANEKTCDIKFMMTTNEGMTDGEDTMIYEKGVWRFDKTQGVR